jgi:hypothetical protein
MVFEDFFVGAAGNQKDPENLGQFLFKGKIFKQKKCFVEFCQTKLFEYLKPNFVVWFFNYFRPKNVPKYFLPNFKPFSFQFL